ncbi:MAG: DMT family transporter [Candidatus Omnitrophica bacterium]|nr:DMT family transporter [Candidatus Omnitrophota bacterium]
MIWIIITVLVGMVLPMQAGINASLAKHLGSTPQAALVSFAGGLLMMMVFCMVSRDNLPPVKNLAAVPPVLLIGGFLGGLLVITSIIVAPRIGAVALVAALVSGQLIFSAVLDHYGWLGYAMRPINAWRLLGIVFLLIGVWIVQRC